MTPRQFADLAAAVSRHAETLYAGDGPDPVTLHRVWKRSSRCFRIWHEELVSSATPGLYAELFSAELPLRTWCTAVAGAGKRSANAGGAIAAKVFADLLELRCTALQALAADHGLTAPEAAALDRFRRRCERWTDVLLGPLVSRTGMTDFAIRPDRAADFGGEQADPIGESSWPLLQAGLRLAFTGADEFRTASSTRDTSLTSQLSAAIVATFPPAAFDSTGRFQSPGLARLSRLVDERRPTKNRRIPSPAKSEQLPVSVDMPPEPTARHAAPISFASVRKPRPAGS